MGTTSQFHIGVHLKTVATLMQVFLRHITYVEGKPFMKMNMTNISELPNFKCNVAFHISKIRDTAIELGSRGSFQELEFRPMQQW